MVKLRVECPKAVKRAERMKRVALMLRFQMINGSIKVYRDGKYKRRQNDKTKVKRKNKDIKKRFLEEIMTFSLNLSEVYIEISGCYK